MRKDKKEKFTNIMTNALFNQNEINTYFHGYNQHTNTQKILDVNLFLIIIPAELLNPFRHISTSVNFSIYNPYKSFSLHSGQIERD